MFFLSALKEAVWQGENNDKDRIDSACKTNDGHVCDRTKRS